MNGICFHCGRDNTGEFWCKDCDPSIIVNEWNIDDEDLREFILGCLSKARNHYDPYFEYVLFGQLVIGEQISEGTYHATWNRFLPGAKRKVTDSQEVAVKEIKNELTPKFLSQIKAYVKCHTDYDDEDGCSNVDNILRLSGITKNSDTGNYMLVMSCKTLNLRNFLDNDFPNFEWKTKIGILHRISKGLKRIHDAGLVHGDLHCGNILIERKDNNTTNVFITGFGLLADERIDDDDTNVQGVLPYIAPEVLYGNPQTKESDIYSLGVIMTEMITGKPPFHNRPHNEELAREICEKGLRPDVEIFKLTPRLYFKLTKECLDSDPAKRPNIQELEDTLENWYSALYGMSGVEDGRTIKVHFESHSVVSTDLDYQCDEGASYVRRLFKFDQFSTPKNSKDHYDY